ncbi:hypothetical protein SAMN05446037_101359 [Anaerovirgula multivorans]|uniref:Uncharacterized protein n=1 Tax=Anaerovirgula multivorans TaxID=312168 RepID=A0A239FM23_9FIRM|nr:hypothetical protein [Anaerovirgula multivorans]SNS57292.1 hypothetical protein SAMN05446037_101359 [Anaerovirgula multivorans]
MKISSSLIIPFIRFFSNAKIMEIAINTGFLKRKRKTTLEILQGYCLPKINYQNIA